MIYIAANEEEGKRMGVKEVAEAIDSPEAFTAKILQLLAKHGLVDSFKGPTGGFSLIQDRSITLREVVLAVDGDKLMEQCVLGLDECSGANPCPVHHKFVAIREQLESGLLSTNLKDEELMKYYTTN